MDLLRLQAGSLSVDEALGHVTHPSAGGVCVFIGTVRDDATRLEYEAYEEQAEAAMAKVAAEVRASVTDLVGLAIIHRHGDLSVGELAVVVAASAPHRAAAFTAARMAIDLVKERVPIWKKEHKPDGTSEWVACHIASGVVGEGGGVAKQPSAEQFLTRGAKPGHESPVPSMAAGRPASGHPLT